MPQTAKMIDVTRSYIPIDPNTYAANLALSRYQDAPDQASPIVAYDGKNFIPTVSGYKSYFGIDRAVQTDSLPSRADHVISFQNAAYQNILVAMCEDGIYIKHGADYGAWVKKVSVETSGGQYKEWSYCVLADAIYCYRTNDLQYYCIPSKVASANLEFYPMSPYMHIQTEAGSQYDPMPVGTYSFKVMGQLKTGWVTALSAASAELTITTPSSILLWINEANVTKYSDKYAFIRFYITKGAVTKYIDVVATSSDIAQVRLTATAWGSAQVVTEVPDEDMLSKPFTASQPVIGITPSFLNMAGQLGIFSAGTRLGFWDSEDSVSWSSMDDYTDFTPSLTTLAGSAIFSDVTGRIVTIQQLGDGFVIYSTQSIVYVAKEEGQLLLWSPKQLAKIGLSYRKQVTPSYYKHEHYAWTGDGLMRVAAGQVELIVPEVLDLMKKHNSPVYPELIDGRYLCLQIMDKDFELRRVLSSEITVEGDSLIFESGGDYTREEALLRADTYIQQRGADGYDKITEVVDAAHSYAGMAATQLQKIYDLKLSRGFGRSGQMSTEPSRIGFSPLAERTGGVGYMLISDKNDGLPGLSGVGAFLPTGPFLIEHPTNPSTVITHYTEIGTKSRRLSNVKAFISVQQELWNRADSAMKDSINKLIAANTYSVRSTFADARAGVLSIGPFDPNKSDDMKAALFTAHMQWINAVMAHYNYSCKLPSGYKMRIGYIPWKYTPAELEVTDTKFALHRRCVGVRPVYLRTVYDKADARMYNVEPAKHWITLSASYSATSSNGYNYSWTGTPVTVQYVSNQARLMGVTIAAPFNASITAVDPITQVNHDDQTLAYEGFELISSSISTMYNCQTETQEWRRSWTDGSVTSSVVINRVKLFYATGMYEAIGKVSLELGPVEMGNYFVDRGEMLLKSYYNPLTDTEYAASAGAPYRGPYALEQYQFNEDTVDPQKGTVVGETVFNPYNLTVDSVWPDISPLTWTPVYTSVQFPDYEFVLQEGSPAPAYPTFYGAYVYDLFLKKWGKLDQEYSLLLNYSAINGQNGQPVSFNAFQMNSGILDTYGAIRLFDDKPSESFIRYGKIGYDRKGFTAAEEVRVGFSSPSTCTVALEPSITGVSIEKNLKDSVSVVSANGATLFANLSARWYNVAISGKYDINYLEFRGHSSGRR